MSHASPAVALAVLLTAASAAAQDGPLARAASLFDQADFRGAIAAFDEAEAGDGLRRDELVDLYENRASAYLALGDAGSMGRDLVRLARIDPTHGFAPATRPEVRDAFEEIRAAHRALELRARQAVEVGGARFSAQVENDGESLVRSIRVYARVVGGEWMSGEGSVFVPATTNMEIEHYAEATGPGGAIVASAGAADAPARFTYTAPTALETNGPGVDSTPHHRGNGLVIGLVAGGIVLVAVAVVLSIVLTSSGNDITQPDPPTIYP